MNYIELLSQTERKIDALKSDIAKLEGTVESIARKLGLDTTKDLAPQLEELQKQLNTSKETLEADIEKALKEVEALENA